MLSPSQFEPAVVFVRYRGGTYIARCELRQATSTHSEQWAARAAALKWFGVVSQAVGGGPVQAEFIALKKVCDGMFVARVEQISAGDTRRVHTSSSEGPASVVFSAGGAGVSASHSCRGRAKGVG